MRNYRDVLNAYNDGRTHSYHFRKVSGIMPTRGWFDLSYSGGLPLANYYASNPLTFTPMESNKGMYTGAIGGQKYVHKLAVHAQGYSTSLPDRIGNTKFILMDYIAFAPFIDFDTTDEQELVTIDLPRYTDGKGVMAMVVNQGTGIANVNMTMTYINQDGNESVSTSTLITTGNAGAIMSAGDGTLDVDGVYLRLAQGDYGIRKITKVQMSATVGAIGAIVLVKPICQTYLTEGFCVAELDYLMDKGNLPKVHNDAYLNFICSSYYTATQTPAFHGYLDFVWEE